MRNRGALTPKTERAAGLEFVAEAGEAVLLAEEFPGLEPVAAGALLGQVAADTHLFTVARLATQQDAKDGWESRAIARLRSEGSDLVLRLAARALEAGEWDDDGRRRRKLTERAVMGRWTLWTEGMAEPLGRVDAMAKRIEGSNVRGLAPALVLQSLIGDLTRERGTGLTIRAGALPDR
jgi:hypothetical protein